MSLTNRILSTLFLLIILSGFIYFANKKQNEHDCAKCAIWNEYPCELLVCNK